MLRVDHHGLTTRVLAVDLIVPPHIATGLHRHVMSRAAQNDHFADRGAARLERFVSGRFQLDHMPATPAAIRRDEQRRLRVLDAILQRVRGETTEHDRVHRADARARLHRNHGLWHEWHVDDNAVTRLHTVGEKHVCEAADLGMQLAIRHVARVTGLALKDDRRLVAAFREVPIEAIRGHIQFPVGEPAIVRRAGIVERDTEGLVPVDLGARQIGPETHVIGSGSLPHRLNICGRQTRFGDECGRRWKNAILGQDGFDVFVLGHATLPLQKLSLSQLREYPTNRSI